MTLWSHLEPSLEFGTSLAPLHVPILGSLGYSRLTGGGYKSKDEKFQDVERKVATLMKRGPDGKLERESGFQRITWKLKSKPLDTLIQYVGDDTLSQPLLHKNSKKNAVPRTTTKPSVLR